MLVQLYAYAGFPRSLNALNNLMAVLEERKKRVSMMQQAESHLLILPVKPCCKQEQKIKQNL